MPKLALREFARMGLQVVQFRGDADAPGSFAPIRLHAIRCLGLRDAATRDGRL